MLKVKGNVLKDPILKRIVEVIVKEIDPDKIILFSSRAMGDYKEEVGRYNQLRHKWFLFY